MDIPPELAALIRPRKICLCKSVSEADIGQAFKKGAVSVDAIIKATNASTGCGTCIHELTDFVESLRAKEQKKKRPSLFK